MLKLKDVAEHTESASNHTEKGKIWMHWYETEFFMFTES